jgi:hypothetical protein
MRKETQPKLPSSSPLRALADSQDQRERDQLDIERANAIVDDSDVQFIGGIQDAYMGAVVDLDNYHYLICSENIKSNGSARVKLYESRRNGYEIAPHPDTPSGKADFPEIGTAIMRLPIAEWNRRQRAKEKRIAALSGIVDGRADRAKERDDSTGIEFERTQNVTAVSAEDLGIPDPN